MQIDLELGPYYQVTYTDGSIIKFQVVGGEPLNVRVINEQYKVVETKPLLLIGNIEKIEKLKNK